MSKKGKSDLSRRSFLKTGAAGAAVVAASAAFPGSAVAGGDAIGKPVEQCHTWSWEAPVKPIPERHVKNTVKSDVIVIGAGLSGLAAAISAAENGASVQLVDKNPSWAARGGHITAFGSKLQRKMGIDNDYRQIIRDWIAWAQGRIDEDLLWLFARKSGACMDWAIDISEKYNLQVTMWEGYYKGPDYTEYPVTHIFHEKDADLSYVYGNSKGIGNVTLVPAFEKEAKAQGVHFNYKMPAVQIIRDEQGNLQGIYAGKPGRYTRFLADKVIIATGDYASNRELIQRYSPFTLNADAQIYFPNKCNTGDGIIMAMQAGGAMQRYEPHAAVIHLEAGAASYGFLHVNALGDRFKNEDVNTQSKSCTKELEPDGIAWTIYDKDWADQVKYQVDNNLGGGLFYGQMWQPWGKGWNKEVEIMTQKAHIKDGKVLVANSIEELASKMNVPVENLKKTVARYNELYKMQDDPDYGKRKELLTPIVKPPFYAGKLASTVLTMCGGLRTDTSLQVLDSDGDPIKGLYVVGAAQGEFFANDYPTICPGIGHGRCLTFGRMAGMLAAGKNPEKLIPSIDL
ncbi:fumarate reductase/succinate dehydrogenase flavoprotein domain protein [Denitrovibrio acetiphilus DSM 12809]|uniref:Fumarate reductase/succinate dehydrogenase flavoprotein domain protein n=1 Tax=Denitrovibrio acetiphilus (strain DSM 12809 / NBRC 114555 / N2460) TaxID=522772 RepID=D4H8J7_DENA2|nr:FAD-dependent oxidoreductase [Denitrovibrio acetiphilus]ADD68346.1 fumarate reductase/succinate dehydrogenase flavoprotein domain protein [Denitrovibrio acetiphilus DSM 12809]